MEATSPAVTTAVTLVSGEVDWCVSSISISASLSGYPMEIRAMNRSRCASGRGYVPSISIGFCVATTIKGSSSL